MGGSRMRAGYGWEGSWRSSRLGGDGWGGSWGRSQGGEVMGAGSWGRSQVRLRVGGQSRVEGHRWGEVGGGSHRWGSWWGWGGPRGLWGGPAWVWRTHRCTRARRPRSAFLPSAPTRFCSMNLGGTQGMRGVGVVRRPRPLAPAPPPRPQPRSQVLQVQQPLEGVVRDQPHDPARQQPAERGRLGPEAWVLCGGAPCTDVYTPFLHAHSPRFAHARNPCTPAPYSSCRPRASMKLPSPSSGISKWTKDLVGWRGAGGDGLGQNRTRSASRMGPDPRRQLSRVLVPDPGPA